MRGLALAALLLVGCSSNRPAAEVKSPAAQPANNATTRLQGPLGEVALGDSLAQAQKVFPAPKGAQVMQTSMSFAILGEKGWGWGRQPAEAFEVALRDGKIVDISHVQGNPWSEPQMTEHQVGPPTDRFEGKVADAYVWDAGENVRFLIRVRKDTLLMPAGTMTIIGKKEDLKMLNYRADDPATIVKQLDSMAAQPTSGEMSKVFEEAKNRAKRK